VDIIRAVRDAVGPPVDLLIEGHSRFNVATAVEFAEAIHQFRPTWFEEPVPHTNIPAIVEVARRSPVPIATGESLSTKQQFAELLKHEVVNILQPDFSLPPTPPNKPTWSPNPTQPALCSRANSSSLLPGHVAFTSE
jgi:L-alanine-DL-glutamate epimerase-like enolase superfamily enzyme